MADTECGTLSILRHYFKLGHKAAEATRKIPEVEADDTTKR